MNDKRYPLDGKGGDSPLDEAVKAVLAEPIPEDAVERVKSRARTLANPPAVTLPNNQGSPAQKRKMLRTLVGGFSLAAVLLVIGAGVILLLDRAGGNAFAQMIEKVKATRSVHFKTANRFGQKPAIEGQLFLEGNRLRCEQFGGLLVQVWDLDRKQTLFLNTHGKIAQSVDFDPSMARAFANPIDQLRCANTKDAEQIGQEILRGRRTQVYRLRKVDLLGMKGNGEMLVWVDVESELPAKITIHDPDPKAEMEMRFDEFVWNEPLDAQLFSLSIPDGFQKGNVILLPEPTPPGAKTPEPPAPSRTASSAATGFRFGLSGIGRERRLPR